jgi:hypothetical protein
MVLNVLRVDCVCFSGLMMQNKRMRLRRGSVDFRVLKSGYFHAPGAGFPPMDGMSGLS